MKILKIISIATALFLSTSANSSLVERLGGQAYYDTSLNITWLADANYSMTSGYDDDGRMNWDEALAWADQLVYEGYSDWRLPSTNTWCYSFDCASSEMGHLFYVDFGNVSLVDNTDPEFLLFSNFQAHFYWSATDASPDEPTYAWAFDFGNGSQGLGGKSYNYLYALAVYDGDISAVPLPAAAWLFGTGILTLIGFARRKKAQ